MIHYIGPTKRVNFYICNVLGVVRKWGEIIHYGAFSPTFLSFQYVWSPSGYHHCGDDLVCKPLLETIGQHIEK